MADENRYARDWNEYSRTWEQQFGRKYQHLGDEWNDDTTESRKRDEFYFSILADRFVQPGMTALEIGPGGGKWTVRLARRVKKLICLDVAEEMLRRTERRCQEEGLTNVEFVLGNGADFRPIADESIDFFFSYDVFVHLALEDTFAYVHEMNRVMSPGAAGTCHHAIFSVPQSFNRIERMNEWYRGGKHTVGQYFYYSPEALRRMYEHCGLQVHQQLIEDWHCMCMFARAKNSPVPKFEQLLWQLMSPECATAANRQPLVAALRQLPAELDRAISPLLDQLSRADDFHTRVNLAEEIRKIWRGLTTKSDQT
jgi:ubiquinone/menaquinone biosynthesis C-methylase UbiE